jgi:DNA-binding transcriptional ArsR family regulator
VLSHILAPMHAFDVLGDPVRRRILELLAEGELSSGAIGEVVQAEFGITQPAVSQHLKVLKDAGLVIDRPAGARRIYQLDPDGVGALRAYLDQFWSRALAAYKTAVEQRPEEVS